MAESAKRSGRSDILPGVEKAYRRALLDMPYCSISVKLLCERSGITRKSFYKRFGGKGDVLRAIIERDVIDPQLELIDILSFEKMRLHASQMELHMFQAVAADDAFYCNVVRAEQGGREAFLKAMSRAFHDFNVKILGECSYHGDDCHAEAIANYFAHGKAHYFLDWIEGGFSTSAEDAAKLYSRMALPFWNSLGA